MYVAVRKIFDSAYLALGEVIHYSLTFDLHDNQHQRAEDASKENEKHPSHVLQPQPGRAACFLFGLLDTLALLVPPFLAQLFDDSRFT